MKPVAQRDLARLRPWCQALRDNRRLLRISLAAPTRRSGQNLHPTKTVSINRQITWHTIPLFNEPMQQDHAIPVVRCKVGIRLRLPSNTCLPRCTAARMASVDLVPAERFGLVIGFCDEAVDGGLKLDDRCEDAAFQPVPGELGKQLAKVVGSASDR
jgi:hypothetical protein